MKQISGGSVIISFFRELSLLFILLWLINPQTKFFQYYNWNIYGAVLLLWIFFAFAADSKAFIKAIMSNHMLLIWLWPIYLLTASLFGHAEFSIKQMTTPFIYCFFGYYYETEKKKGLKICFFAAFLYSLIITVNSFMLNQNSSELSRILAHGDALETYALSSPFLADFRFIYALVALSLVIVGLYKLSCQSKVRKLFLIICWIWLLFVFITVQYVIALMTVIILSSVIILFVSASSRHDKGVVTIKKVISFVLIATASIVIIVNYRSILLLMYNNIDESNFKIKIMSVINASGTTGLTTLERAQLYGTSISTFFSSIRNFIFGVGYDANVSLIGQHSSLFDTFGRYGILGGSAMLASLIVTARQIKKKMNYKEGQLFRYLMIAYGIEFVLNPVYSDVILLFFFFIGPMSLVLFDNKNNNIAFQRI